jgi:hypothetical protein
MAHGIYISRLEKLLYVRGIRVNKNPGIAFGCRAFLVYTGRQKAHTQGGPKMRRFQSSLSVRLVVVLTVVSLTFMGSQSICAQKRKPIPTPPVKPPEANTNVNLRSADQAQMEMSLLMSSRNVSTDLERERNRLAAELTRDLEELGRQNTESIAPLSSSKPLDYKEVVQACSDVKARATRIKFYSPITLIDRTGEKIRYDFDDSQIGRMLALLSRDITKFVGNPVFRVSAPNDGELRSVAAHELEGIIKLSDAIAKTAKKSSKTLVADK